jgi:hypothetical protein
MGGQFLGLFGLSGITAFLFAGQRRVTPLEKSTASEPGGSK